VIPLLLVGSAWADPGAHVESANAALARGDYAAAEGEYRALLADGATTVDVWYNLGNILYRQERVAEAVHAWRSAAALAPRDPDVEANLNFVRPKLRDGLVAPDARPWWAPWQVALTAAEGVWIGAALLGLGLAGAALRASRPGWPLLPVGAGLGLCGALVAAGGFAEATGPRVAVVVATEVVATSDLGGGVELFTLHAGAEVVASEQSVGRVLVTLTDGRKGWLPDAAVRIVDPSEPPSVL
jgi:hypothetical protein